MGTEALTAADTGTQHLAGLRVLVVDDNPPVRGILLTAFGRAGAEVRGAGDAEDAVWSASSRAAEGRPFDAVVLDYMMPRHDGVWAAKQLRVQGFTGAVIGFSAVVDGEAAEAWRGAGCDAVLRKGCPLRDLLTAVAGACGREAEGGRATHTMAPR